MRPVAVHRAQEIAFVPRQRAFDRLLDAEPGAEQQPCLRPCELPRDGAQAADVAAALPTGGTAADVHPSELGFWCRGAEVLHEARMLVDDGAKRLARIGGEPLHAGAPFAAVWPWRQQPGFERPARV